MQIYIQIISVLFYYYRKEFKVNILKFKYDLMRLTFIHTYGSRYGRYDFFGNTKDNVL